MFIYLQILTLIGCLMSIQESIYEKLCNFHDAQLAMQRSKVGEIAL